jgi:hypothetical protein
MGKLAGSCNRLPIAETLATANAAPGALALTLPCLTEPRNVAADTWLIGSWMALPGLGVLPVNAYLIRSAEATLVDTGLSALGERFLARLESLIDFDDLRWIWITHMDPDHAGNLRSILERSPRAQVVTTYLGMCQMGLLGLPKERAFLLNPGQALELKDRSLQALAPPYFDAPETIALFDELTRSYFCADTFGAVQPECIEDVRQVNEETPQDGIRLWTSLDAPWLHAIDRLHLGKALDSVLQLRPRGGAGVPLAAGTRHHGTARYLADAADAPAFVGPDHETLQAMLRQM